MTKKAWQGRFQEQSSKSLESFSSSISFDKALYKHDIDGSIAHAKMLSKQSIIQEDEAKLIEEGLREIQEEIENQEFEYKDELEDIHMHIENRLYEKIGKVAYKLHTARSRNDQVCLDMRLYLRCEAKTILELILAFQKEIIKAAEKNKDIIVSGYTHMQRAQAVLLSHHLMAYFEMFARDFERIFDAIKRINIMPLGAAALAGVNYDIDRNFVAKELNFDKITNNSIDTVSDRDFIIEFVSCASILMVHLSRMSEEVIYWSSSEFDFIEIADKFTTGSSIMPQKKNPDIAEITRGKTGRVFGSLVSILTIMKSLPLAYNRDMQEDKIPLFDTVKTIKACLDIYTQMLPAIKFKKENMRKSCKDGFLDATDMADYLANKNMPFRLAHETVGKVVFYAISQEKRLEELTLKELKKFSVLFEKDIFDFLTLESIINRKNSPGGTAKKRVKEEISNAKRLLTKQNKTIKKINF